VTTCDAVACRGLMWELMGSQFEEILILMFVDVCGCLWMFVDVCVFGIEQFKKLCH
jgi:hypothetical protein